MNNIKIGDKFNCYDDGKATPSRHSVVTIIDIIPAKKWTDRHKELVYITLDEDGGDLFSLDQPYLIIGENESNDKIAFLKTTYDGYFSTGWIGGSLDVTGEITENLIHYLNEGVFDYTSDEIDYIIECLTEKKPITLNSETKNLLNYMKNIMS